MLLYPLPKSKQAIFHVNILEFISLCFSLKLHRNPVRPSVPFSYEPNNILGMARIFPCPLLFPHFSILGVRGILKCVLFSYPARGKMAELQARRESRRFRNTYKWGAFAVRPYRRGSRLVLRQNILIGIASIARMYCAPSEILTSEPVLLFSTRATWFAAFIPR